MARGAPFFVVAAMTVLGCGHFDRAPTSASSASTTAAAYERGDVLQYFPARCPGGALYLDVAELVAHPAIAPYVPALGERLKKVLEARRPGAWAAWARAFESAGVDAGKDIHDVAVCADGAKNDVVLFGGDFARKNVLDALVGVSGGSIFVQREIGGVRYVTDMQAKDPRVIARLSPNVYAITLRVDVLPELAVPARSPLYEEWRDALVGIAASGRPKDAFRAVTLRFERGFGRVAVHFVVVPTVKQATAIASTPKPAAEKEVRQVLWKMANGVQPLLADDLRAADVDVSPQAVTIDLSLPDSDVRTLVGRALAASE